MNSVRKLKHLLCAAVCLLAGGTAHAGLTADIPSLRPGETAEATVSVGNPASATAMQFTINLPEGFSIPGGKLTLADRAAGHSSEINAKGGGEYKCVIYSASNTPFVGTDGPLFTFALQAPASAASGEYTIRFSGIRFSGIDGNETSEQDATAKVRIFVPVESISLSSTSMELTRGASAVLMATISPDNATDKNISWTSDNTGVASVDASGKVIAIGVGSATITAKAADGSGISASCRVTVTPILVSSIVLNYSDYNTCIGETVKLTATVGPEDADNRSVTWNSDNTGVATVAQDGTVTALSAGTAVITVRANDASGVSASCVVNVGLPAVESVSVDPAALTLYTGESASLKATVSPASASQAVSWTSSAASVATVSSDGTVSALALGTATITATATDGSGKSGVCTVTVLPLPVSSITLDITESNLTIGESVRLTATVSPAEAYDRSVTWSSDNVGVATVAQDGTVTALSAGTAIITVRANDASGVSASCVVNVGLPAVESVSVDPAALTLYTGESASLKATVSPATASQAVSWTSSAASVATVSSDGMVSALAPGTATITATATDSSGKSGVCTVTVLPLPVSAITLDITESNLTIGESVGLTATVSPAEAYDRSVTWSSDNAGVATVAQDGTVTALSAGTAIITVRANDASGVSASCVVNVGLPAVESVSVDPAALTLYTGETSSLKATVLPATASQAVNWTSSAASVANVSSDGTVSALAPGTVTITATATDGSGKSGVCTVTVLPLPVSAITLDITESNLTIGESVRLTATVSPAEAYDRSVTWSSDNAGVAMVAQDGTVTALSAGTTIITVRANDASGVSASCVVNVLLPAPQAIVVLPNEITLKEDSVFQLYATVIPAEASQEMEWSSEDTNIATVTQDGLVTSVKAGETRIRIRSKEYPAVAAFCMVKVTENAGISVNYMDSLNLTVTQNGIVITGKDADTTVEIIDMTGKLVRMTKDSVIGGLDHGVYIVIAGSTRIKVRI